MAAIGSLEYAKEQNLLSDIVVQSDSKYVIQGITSWVKGWQRNGWITAGKKEVGNRDLWERLDLAAKGLSIQWKYVKGHAGHPGNERCDELATSFADKAEIALYSGDRDKYPVDLDAEPLPSAQKAKSSKSKSGVKAYSYLSLIDGEFQKHATWTECEARVKGKRGAKFKKSISAQDEGEIMSEWGVKG